jgi:RHS repeat-associated protein
MDIIRYISIAWLLFFISSSAVLANYPYNGSLKGQVDVSSSGAAIYTIPIEVPPGVNGHQPHLSLVYNSQGGNGPLGVGWTLSGLSAIYRCPAQFEPDGYKGAVNLDNDDRFCLDGKKLILTSGSYYGAPSSQYRTEIDNFARITAYNLTSSNSGPEYFIVETKDGKEIQYGWAGNSGVKQQGGSGSYLSWNIAKVTGRSGNTITYKYTSDWEFNSSGYYPLERIDYNNNLPLGNSASLRFEYEARNDLIKQFVAGSRTFIFQRLIHIKTFVGEYNVRSYSLTYSDSVDRSQLDSIKECDFNSLNCKTTKKLSWQLMEDGRFYSYVATSGGCYGNSCSNLSSDSVHIADFNGDGMADIMHRGGNFDVWLAKGDGRFYSYVATSGGCYGNSCSNLSGSRIHIADFNGDGIADVMHRGGNFDVWLGKGDGRFYPYVATPGGCYGNSCANLSADKLHIGDFNGDGKADVMYRGGNFDVWLSKGDGRFEPYVATAGGCYGNSCSNLSGDRIHIADFNGDGISDVMHRGGNFDVWLGSSNGRFEPYVATSGGCYGGSCSSLSSDKVYVSDFNGDGKADVMYRGGNFDVWLSKGNGRFESYVATSGGCYGGSCSGLSADKVHIADYNGDGITDVMNRGGNLDVWLGKGDGRFKPYVATSGGCYGSSCSNLSGGRLRVADFDGDGTADVLHRGGNFDVWRGGSIFKKGLLASIYDEAESGQFTSFYYKPLTDNSIYKKYTNANPASNNIRDVQNAMYVVSSLYMSNGVGGSNRVTYFYEGAKAHLKGRGFLGFARIRKTDHTSGIVTTTNYRQQTNSGNFWLNGLLYYQYQQHNGRMLSYDVNYWTSKTSNAGRVYPVAYAQYHYKYDFGTLMNRVYTGIPTANIDAYGNIGRKIVETYDYQSTKRYKTTTDTTYYPVDTYNWRLGLVDSLSTTYTVPDEREGFAGGTQTKTNKTKYTYHPNSFLVKDEIAEPDEPGTSNLRQTTTYAYDSYGNKTRMTVSGAGINPARVKKITYDYSYAYDRFKVTLTNEVNHTEERVYDWRTGNMVGMIGPNRILGSSGFTTQWIYDGFGRKGKEIRADGNETHWSYQCINYNCAPTAAGEVYYVTETISGQPSVSVYYDRLGRKVRTMKDGFNNSLIERRIVYDALGRIKGQTNNYFTYPVSRTPNWTCYEYDTHDRLTQQTVPSTVGCDYIASLATFKSISYSGYLTTETTYNTGQNGASTQVKRQWENALGELAKVQDAAGHYTYYAYNAIGNLIEVRDALGNKYQAGYDRHGRKRTMDDPDMGHWEYDYNAAGELTWQKDAKQQVVTMTYDALGRIKYRYEPDGSTTTWVYDTTYKGKGKLASVSNNYSGYARILGYDAYGRVATVNTQVLNTPYRMNTSYDQYGRVASKTYPSSIGSTRFKTQNCYDAHGYLKEVRAPGSCGGGGTVYWKANGQNANGKVTSETLGNGVNSIHLYDDQWGYLTDISAGKGTTLQSSHFEYDRLGNMEERRFSSRPGVLQDVVETFGYDAMNRLTSANTSGPFGSLSKSYSYDAIGNIRSKSDFGNDYQYGNGISVDGAGPHAVTRVYNGNTLVGGYFYDANGNMTLGKGRKLTYTWFNKVRSAEYGSDYSVFLYDSEHMRIVQTSSQGMTVYVNPRLDTGGHYEREYEGGVTVHKHYIYGANGVAGVYKLKSNGAPAETDYFLKDHLGSIEVVLDQLGNQKERLSYDAFGQRRNVTGSDPASQIIALTTHHGFTGHEHLDHLGLIHMNGRLYDPQLGRMLQADFLVQDNSNSQSFNRYTYGFNNPLYYYDPDGQFAIVAVVIGALAGAYAGYQIAEAHGYDLGDIEAWGYIIGGAVIGGVSGGIGAEIAAAGGFMANTMGLMVSSFINSVGMSVLSGGMTDVSISIGFGSYNLSRGEFSYLYDGDNSDMENFGYVMGAMANIRDINQYYNQTPYNVHTKKIDSAADLPSHTAIEPANGQGPVISHGPHPQSSKLEIATISKSTVNPISRDYTIRIDLNVHVVDTVARASRNLPYQWLTVNCVNMGSAALWANGIPNIPIHPYLLHASLTAYQAGVRPDLMSYYFTQQDYD